MSALIKAHDRVVAYSKLVEALRIIAAEHLALLPEGSQVTEAMRDAEALLRELGERT